MARVLEGFEAVGRPVPAAAGILPIDFRRLLGEAAWAQLPAAVRHRFGVHAHDVVYRGQMTVRASLFGRLVAQVCRLIGTPLAPWTGEDVPVDVDVHMNGRGGLVWARTYSFAGHRPLLVSSTKLMDARGGLMEVVRGGLGMALTTTVEDAALHFRSRFYFVEIAGLRLRIPGLLTPGAAHVIHRDESGGAFRFTMSFRHPWLGETLYQDGIFRDPE